MIGKNDTHFLEAVKLSLIGGFENPSYFRILSRVMEASNKILSEISRLTRYIEENYPELTKYLEENPLTISGNSSGKGDMDDKALGDYLNSLKSLIETYKKQH
jgi:hypothetical protein